MNWKTRITYIDIDTGEQLDHTSSKDAEKKIRESYDLRAKHTKTYVNRTTNHGTKYITYEVTSSKQLKLNL